MPRRENPSLVLLNLGSIREGFGKENILDGQDELTEITAIRREFMN